MVLASVVDHVATVHKSDMVLFEEAIDSTMYKSVLQKN